MTHLQDARKTGAFASVCGKAGIILTDCLIGHTLDLYLKGPLLHLCLQNEYTSCNCASYKMHSIAMTYIVCLMEDFNIILYLCVQLLKGYIGFLGLLY